MDSSNNNIEGSKMSAWSKLSKIDVSNHTQKKGSLTYLSWAWAWGTLVENFPDSTYEFLENEVHNDSTVTVHCRLTVDGLTHAMWLPVMDNRNKAIQAPTARDISDAKMRCLVKAIAMHGLGHYIFAGEDIPSSTPETRQAPAYDGEAFHANYPKWEQMVDEGKVTPEKLLAFLESKASLTEAQRANILGLGAHA